MGRRSQMKGNPGDPVNESSCLGEKGVTERYGIRIGCSGISHQRRHELVGAAHHLLDGRILFGTLLLDNYVFYPE